MTDTIATGVACYYCGQLAHGRNLHKDHIKPRSRGGTNNPKNLVLCCGSCNSTKGNRTIAEVRNRLLQRIIQWPKFSDDQLSWLRGRGFDFAEFDSAKLAFEINQPQRKKAL